MARISEIRLSGVVPKVFETERGGMRSQVWAAELTFRRPGRYFVKAESGGGKSSMCAYIYGLRDDFSGQILFDGVDTTTLTIEQWSRLRRSSLAYLPQDLRLFPELTAMENIQIKNRLTSAKTDEEIMEMLRQLGVDAKAFEPVGRLSIGQQQRVAAVRALCQPFDFLLLDEPVSHLDSRNNEALARLIEQEASRNEAAIIATSVGNDLSINQCIEIAL